GAAPSASRPTAAGSRPTSRRPPGGERSSAPRDPARACAAEAAVAAHKRRARGRAAPTRPPGLRAPGPRRRLARSRAARRGRTAVAALLGADPLRRAPRLVLGANPQELAQEHVLGVHRDVRLQLALPPAALVLEREQALACELERDPCPAGRLHRRRSHGGNLKLFEDGRHLRDALNRAPRRRLRARPQALAPRGGRA